MSLYPKTVVFSPGVLYEKDLSLSVGYTSWIRILDWEPNVVNMRNKHKPIISYYHAYTINSECVLT